MKVQFLLNSYNSKKNIKMTPAFKSNVPIETIKHYNLGIMSNGFIGKVKVLKIITGKEAFLNVFKYATPLYEEYSLKDDFNRIIGKIELKENKYNLYDDYNNETNLRNIFVTELKNYSTPNTPYYVNGLDEYKQVGVRLMQIAQRRSDERGLGGNIELISKNEAIGFYEKLGFKKFPNVSKYQNPNKMYLPAESKEPLSKKYGGL